MAVLNIHLHSRYRTYEEIEANSSCYSTRYGTTSLSRCLHDNSSIEGVWHAGGGGGGGAPCWRPSDYLGINLAVSDYYDIELIEIEIPISWLTRPIPLPAPLVPQEVPRGRGIN